MTTSSGARRARRRRRARVDLAEVNGRVFVNNVSLGVYAEAVQRPGYREAKMRTLLDTIPAVVGPDAQRQPLRWTDRMAGSARVGRRWSYPTTATAWAASSAREPARSLDEGLLGIIVADAPTDARAHRHRHSRPWREWTAPSFTVQAPERVSAGIDGEAGRSTRRALRHAPGVRTCASLPSILAHRHRPRCPTRLGTRYARSRGSRQATMSRPLRHRDDPPRLLAVPRMAQSTRAQPEVAQSSLLDDGHRRPTVRRSCSFVETRPRLELTRWSQF